MENISQEQQAALAPSFVDQVAARLGERPAAAIRRQLRAVLGRGGRDRLLALVEEAEAIEAGGGLLVHDGSRRRTLGGVFFALARQQGLLEAQPWARAARLRPEGAAPAPPTSPSLPPATWADVPALMAAREPGKVNSVKATLIGRPAKVVAREGFTLLTLERSGPLPSLPKGVPTPATLEPTTFIVYVGAKQWRGVAAALEQPDDVLIVEGVPYLDSRFNAITVFATSATTKALQQAKRQQQQGT